MIKINFVPKKVFFTKGKGYADSEACSFENALENAGISQFNLVEVSSILPPNCKFVSKEQGLKNLKPGQIVFCVSSIITSKKSNEWIGAGIGCAVSKNKKQHGFLCKYSAQGKDEDEISRHTEKLALSLFASSIPLNSKEKNKKHLNINNENVKTFSVVQTALCKKNEYSTVVAFAVFVL